MCILALSMMVTAGVVYAGGEHPLAAALPQPSTIFICVTAAAFFKCVAKRVP